MNTSFLVKMFKYGVVGVLATAINTAILFFTVSQWHWDPVVGNTAGFCVAVINSYWLNRIWTFQSGESMGRTMYRYLIVSVCSMLISDFLMWIAVHQWHWDYKMANVLIIGIMPFVNFSMNHYWTFSETPMEELEAA